MQQRTRVRFPAAPPTKTGPRDTLGPVFFFVGQVTIDSVELIQPEATAVSNSGHEQRAHSISAYRQTGARAVTGRAGPRRRERRESGPQSAVAPGRSAHVDVHLDASARRPDTRHIGAAVAVPVPGLERARTVSGRGCPMGAEPNSRRVPGRSRGGRRPFDGWPHRRCTGRRSIHAAHARERALQ